MEVEYDPRYAPKGADTIPYAILRRRLFPPEQPTGPFEQKVVPFLGAGASLPYKPPSPPAKLTNPEQELIDRLCQDLGLERAESRGLIELAARVARKMEEPDSPSAGSGAPTGAAPSAAMLAAILASEVGYRYLASPANTLEQLLPREMPNLEAVLTAVISITGVASVAPPLLSVASYYQYKEGDEGIWNALRPVFAQVHIITKTHDLVAEIAGNHIRHPNIRELSKHQRNYLLVTTNYDELMEKALYRRKVPGCVVTVSKSGDHVRVRFPNPDLIAEYFGYSAAELARLQRDLEESPSSGKFTPGSFSLDVPKPVAIVYKIHGCIAEGEQSHNTVIISDEDYIENLGKNGTVASLVPIAIKNGLGYCDFLFLGYSFSDWNVRSLFRSLRAVRATVEHKDRAVLLNWHPYEHLFFKKYNIDIAVTDLDAFVDGVRSGGK